MDFYLVSLRIANPSTELTWNLYLRFKRKFELNPTPTAKQKAALYYDSLKSQNGPYVTTLEAILKDVGCLKTQIKGGSLIGDQCYRLFAYTDICNIFLPVTVKTPNRTITLGSEHVVKLMKDYMKLRLKEFALTCKVRSLCLHQILRLQI